MKRIVLFGGTAEGRLLAEVLGNTKVHLEVCVATEYGGRLLPACENVSVHVGRMNEKEIESFLRETAPVYCLDATHPYAAAVTENVFAACKEVKIPYIRVYRQEEGKGEIKVVSVDSVEAAAAFLKGVTGNILITTGSKELEKYTKIPGYKDRCFARVLPVLPVVERCRELGFEGKNLIGMQGPFSEELNYAMIKQINASWLVTKNSGKEGGYQEKCEAAMRAGISVLVVERPKEAGTETDTKKRKVMPLREVLSFLKEELQIENRRVVTLVGIGPGEGKLLTGEAKEALDQCDVVIGADRMVEAVKNGGVKTEGKAFFKSYLKEEIADFLREHEEYQRAAIVYSGDIGFFSGAKRMKELLPEYEVKVASGIASPVYFLNKIGVPWEEVLLVSCHGQKLDLIPLIRSHKRVCALLGKKDQAADICKKLHHFHMDDIVVTVGERLSYPEERIIFGRAEEMAQKEFHALSVVLFENLKFRERTIGAALRDDAFFRGKVPMTKEEIRILSLAKLRLTEKAVLYDVGAGTGSVSLEAALQCERGQVYAIEKKAEAVELICENRLRFFAENLTVVEGKAPECLKKLPKPTHVFIGGSSGELLDIIEEVRKKNKKARFVLNAVTLETIAQLKAIGKAYPEYEDMEVIWVNVAKSRRLSDYHLMNAENPVMIVSFGGEDNEG